MGKRSSLFIRSISDKDKTHHATLGSSISTPHTSTTKLPPHLNSNTNNSLNLTDTDFSLLVGSGNNNGSSNGTNATSTVMSCADFKKKDPSVDSGLFNLQIAAKKYLKVYCDMETAGGGWTVRTRVPRHLA
jgi:hypothetical protein